MLSMNISLLFYVLEVCDRCQGQRVFKCLNATIPLTCTLANEYPSSNEIRKKNGTVRGDCIACDALFSILFLIMSWYQILR